jgi:sortase A
MSLPRRIASVASLVLLVAGLAAVGYVAYVVIDARAYQAAARERLDHPRPAAAAVAPVLAVGAPVGEIRIPRLGLTAMVLHGESAAILQRAVGHLPGTALPGEAGNAVLAGHRDTFFRPLEGVRPGDVITLATPDGEFEYLVEWTSVVPPTAIEVLAPTGGRTLTLITCFPFSYFGAAPDRFIVRAREPEGTL